MYTQTVSIEVDVYARIECRGEMTDYGVPGSPRWMEYEDHDFADYRIDIAGVEVNLSELPAVLRDEILVQAIDACDDMKWESE